MDGARTSLISAKRAQAKQIRAYFLEFGIPPDILFRLNFIITKVRANF